MARSVARSGLSCYGGVSARIGGRSGGGGRCVGFIGGEDGIDYFLHRDELDGLEFANLNYHESQLASAGTCHKRLPCAGELKMLDRASRTFTLSFV
jgi:hypothetical protein